MSLKDVEDKVLEINKCENKLHEIKEAPPPNIEILVKVALAMILIELNTIQWIINLSAIAIVLVLILK